MSRTNSNNRNNGANRNANAGFNGHGSSFNRNSVFVLHLNGDVERWRSYLKSTVEQQFPKLSPMFASNPIDVKVSDKSLANRACFMKKQVQELEIVSRVSEPDFFESIVEFNSIVDRYLNLIKYDAKTNHEKMLKDKNIIVQIAGDGKTAPIERQFVQRIVRPDIGGSGGTGVSSSYVHNPNFERLRNEYSKLLTTEGMKETDVILDNRKALSAVIMASVSRDLKLLVENSEMYTNNLKDNYDPLKLITLVEKFCNNQ
jgi:hypothetical protein